MIWSLSQEVTVMIVLTVLTLIDLVQMVQMMDDICNFLSFQFPPRPRQPWRCSEIWQLLQRPGVLQLPIMAWLQASGLKTRQLDSALAVGPAALLFTRHNPLSPVHHYEAMVRGMLGVRNATRFQFEVHF